MSCKHEKKVGENFPNTISEEKEKKERDGVHT